MDRYHRSGDAKDLEAALQNNQAAVEKTPEGHPDLAGRLQNLAGSFTARYRRSGDVKDLETALQYKQAAVEKTPEGHPDLAGCLQSLAVSFTDRYQRSGDVKDLEAALQNNQAAVEKTPEGHPKLAGRLQNLAVSFRDRYERSGDVKDLEAALQNNQAAAAVAQTPEGHPDLAGRLQGLAGSFTDRYRRSGDVKDLETALQYKQAAVKKTPEGHPDLAGCLQSLAVSFADRYRRSGDVKDLEAALLNNQAAVAQTPEGHPDLAGRLQGLAGSFTDRYRRSGDVKDLETALQYKQAAVKKTPEGHPDLAGCLQSLAVSFADRYRRSGDVKDLEAALQNDQAAVEKTPEGHPYLARRLQNLAVSFANRYRRSGDVKDLEAALLNNQAAVAQTPEGHPGLAGCLQSLATSFRHQYQRSGDVKDLEAALLNNQAAVAQTPEGHPDLAGRLQSLAASFTDRYQRSRDVKDLKAALQNNQAAVAQTPEGHPNMPGCLQDLAVSFMGRYEKSGDVKDLEAALSSFSKSFQCHTSDLEKSWHFATIWASLEKLHRRSAVNAYSAAFHLLPEILWIGSSVSVRQDVNRRMNVSEATSDAIAACIDSLNLTLAVELLEQGLGTTFQQLLQLKTNLDFLPQKEADELKLLSIDLYSGKAQHPQRVAADRNTLINEIRSRQGLANFLRPRPYRDLCQASQHGPIVVLSSHHDHCDSIILLNPTSDPLHLALPSVSVDHLKVQKSLLRDLIKGRNVRSRELPQARLYGYQEGIEVGMDGFLSWVWTCIVQPIYVALNANGITSGRLWWCPTGDFTGLPVHAADSADQFIQSYTPTLGALLEANSKTPSTDPPHIGLVGVTHTGPQRDQELPGVEEEITVINSIAKKRYQVQSLTGENTTVDLVKQALNDCAWMHLACHGEQNITDPPKSCLQLYGGTLELETILQMSLPNAEFVFLAACQTAKGDAALVNESFHLGGGFIAAGFQGAIATMWSMMDEDGPVVAETVYSHLFGSGNRPRASDAAKALQLAVRRLREAGVPYERWVPFIHLGI
ncbi:CHAT domain-containing protein [Mycena rebaudengoi]|nr:CHAT domain-containing protein [Mycena rebaudengoi]